MLIASARSRAIKLTEILPICCLQSAINHRTNGDSNLYFSKIESTYQRKSGSNSVVVTKIDPNSRNAAMIPDPNRNK